jgi:anti-sigma-K factor RskA
MTCGELSSEYGAYSLGIAEDPERQEIAVHLARECPACTAGVKSAMGIVSLISGAVKPVEPPHRLRKRIVAMVASEPRSSWTMFAPWAVAGVLAIALGAITLTPRLHPSDSLSASLSQPDQAKLEQALSILNDPVTKDVVFGEPAARGRVFVSPGKGVVLMAAHLPALEANKTFELWVIPAVGSPIAAGTFRGNADSTAIYVRPGPVDNATAVAVTVEPEGGSAQPTTKPFIVTKL